MGSDSHRLIDMIRVRGARQHNLQDLDLDLPRYSLIVVTGLSGSGKSSLAFDTIYAEGQRRYVESLSAYARQFLEQMERPDVESVEGLSPSIAIEQKTTSRNPRSTVGTVTELYDFLRLLYARVGTPHCPQCDRPVRSQTTAQIAAAILEMEEGSRLQIMAPIVRGRKGEFKDELKRMTRSGYVRARIDGEMRELSEPISLDKNRNHDIEIVVDRVILRHNDKAARRLHDAVDRATRLADGLVIVNLLGEGDELFSKKLACIHCGISIPDLAPRSFSFNSPRGACPACEGLGRVQDFAPDLIVPDPRCALPDGAIHPWQGSSYPARFFTALCERRSQSPAAPWEELDEEFRGLVMHGPGGGGEITLELDADLTDKRLARGFAGVIPILEERLERARSKATVRKLGKYQRESPCRECGGDRLRPESRAVRVGGLAIAELTALPVDQAREALGELEIPERLEPVGEPLVKELRERLSFLEKVGLAYLTLDRPAGSLAGGESQRIRLATQIGTGLRGVLYVLDEPSIGLHQRDNRRLLEALRTIRDQGNTVIVVEHDEETIRAADWVVDLGPGAGEHGGRLVAEGPPDAIAAADSLTGAYLSGARAIEVPADRRRPWPPQPPPPEPADAPAAGDRPGGRLEDDDGARPAATPFPEKPDDSGRYGNGWVVVRGARHHNLKNVDIPIPLGLFTVVTGVSGSGKSSAIQEILYRQLARELYGAVAEPGPHDRIQGIERIDKVIDITQDPIGRTPRSNAATYTSAFTPVRELFASLPESKVRGYDKGRFSFNVAGGRCPECGGGGVKKIEMHFLPDVYALCDECGGRRYNDETLEIVYRGHNIHEVLKMTVDQALEVFENVPKIARKLATLHDVGLGYIRLGQAATTLSGGEAQRVKLSKELSKRSTGQTLYILDEPTTGLHFEDVRRLLDVLDALVEQGNTVVVIEHNLDVVKSADWIVDLGPEGGAGGGELVAMGSPERVSEDDASHTGRFLREMLHGVPVRA